MAGTAAHAMNPKSWLVVPRRSGYDVFLRDSLGGRPRLHCRVVRSKGRGWDLFAARDFAVGEVVGYYSGRQVAPALLASDRMLGLYAHDWDTQARGPQRRHVSLRLFRRMYQEWEWAPAARDCFKRYHFPDAKPDVIVDCADGVTGYVQYALPDRVNPNTTVTRDGFLVARKSITAGEAIRAPPELVVSPHLDDLQSVDGDAIRRFR
jgi:hypothetical protein